MKRMKGCLLVLILIASATGMAWANAGIPIVDPEDNRLLFDPDPGVRLLKETVRFEFEEPRDPTLARVDVVYLLENERPEDRTVEMVFVSPAPEGAGFRVSVGGKPLEGVRTEPMETLPKNWSASGRLSVVEPVSGRSLDNSPSRIGSGPQSFRGTAFRFELPAGKPTDLAISYNSRGGFYRYGEVINRVFSHLYYLTPAAFYTGEPEVTLEVSLPETGAYAFHSNIAMEKGPDGDYRTRLEKLPETEWLFSFASTEGLILGTNNRKAHNGGILAGSGLLWVAAWILWKKRGRKGLAALAGLGGAGCLYFLRPSYGTVFLMYLSAPFVAVLAIAWFAGVQIAKRKKSPRL